MIKYVCKYCGQPMGEFKETDVSEEQLGLLSLTTDERQSIITYMTNGDKIARVTCEFCQETLERTPELALISNPLQ